MPNSDNSIFRSLKQTTGKAYANGTLHTFYETMTHLPLGLKIN
jgi:hypothetical protein